jgi:hypothetical protein
MQLSCICQYPPKKFSVGSEGVAEGGCGGNSAAPERRTSARLRLLVQSRTPKAKFSFPFRRKGSRAKKKIVKKILLEA